MTQPEHWAHLNNIDDEALPINGPFQGLEMQKSWEFPQGSHSQADPLVDAGTGNYISNFSQLHREASAAITPSE